MNVKILQKDEPLLRKMATEVPRDEIGNKKIKEVIQRMRKVIQAEEDAVAIAAPQIGESLRIFVVSGRAQDLAKNQPASMGRLRQNKRPSDGDEKAPLLEVKRDLIFINPVITKTSKKKKPLEEGCLSIRWWYGEVRRATKATIRAYDENGKSFTRGASGLMAQIFQHEIDHLNGILFTDKAENIKEIPPERLTPNIIGN